MKTLNETIREEVKKQMGYTDFAVNNDTELVITSKKRFQIVPESEAAEMMEDFCNYDGFKAVNFEFEGTRYYFVKQ